MCWVDIVMPVVSAIISGGLTLLGVCITIKKSDKKRKEEEKKKARPYFTMRTVEYNETYQPDTLIRFYDEFYEENGCEVSCCKKVVARIKNSPLSVFTVEKIYHDSIWWNTVANKTILQKEAVQLEFYSNSEKNIFLILCDALGNEYNYELILLNQDFYWDNKHFYTIKEFKEISIEEVEKRTKRIN